LIKTIYIKNYLKPESYNFIVSNVILSQSTQFTYNDILNTLKEIYHDDISEVQNTVKKCLIRLRDDGFIHVLSSYYRVEDIKY
jgi:hypothetical protein